MRGICRAPPRPVPTSRGEPPGKREVTPSAAYSPEKQWDFRPPIIPMGYCERLSSRDHPYRLPRLSCRRGQLTKQPPSRVRRWANQQDVPRALGIRSVNVVAPL
jgi:hypothetical protein